MALAGGGDPHRRGSESLSEDMWGGLGLGRTAGSAGREETTWTRACLCAWLPPHPRPSFVSARLRWAQSRPSRARVRCRSMSQPVCSDQGAAVKSARALRSCRGFFCCLLCPPPGRKRLSDCLWSATRGSVVAYSGRGEHFSAVTFQMQLNTDSDRPRPGPTASTPCPSWK